MQSDDVRGLISLAGVITQIAGSLLVLLLFALLQRRAGRDYFGWWTLGWALITLAIVAVAVGSAVMRAGDQPITHDHPGMRVLNFVYQLGKMGGVACLLAGSALYTGRPFTRAQRWTLAAVPPVGALLSVAFLPSLNVFVAWQAPLAVLGFGASAALLLRMDERRRSFGSRATGVTFVVAALLWSVYAVVFHPAVRAMDGAIGPLARSVVTYNSYLDFLVTVFLGFGMVVLLMEEAKHEVEAAKREVDEAHARLAAAHDRLRRSASYDPLTGCLNRQGFAESRAQVAAGAGTVVVIDMDNLKDVNDRYGHPAGDALLRHLARVLEAAAPAHALLFRWGGDEFVVLLPDTPPAEAEERFRAAVGAAPAVDITGVPVPVAVKASVGAARYTSPDALESAMRRADRGMYAHKQWRKGHTGSHAAILP